MSLSYTFIQLTHVGTDVQGKSLATARVKQLALEWKVMDKSEQQVNPCCSM